MERYSDKTERGQRRFQKKKRGQGSIQMRKPGESQNVFRYRKPGKRGIMPANAVSYFNRIDIGIFLCFLDVCLEHQGLEYQRELFVDRGEDNEFTKVAVYHQ